MAFKFCLNIEYVKKISILTLISGLFIVQQKPICFRRIKVLIKTEARGKGEGIAPRVSILFYHFLLFHFANNLPNRKAKRHCY